MEIKIIKEKIRKEELANIVKENYGDMTKAVVDIEKKIMAIGGELHADANEVLIKNGSSQKDVWGINIHPDKPGGQQIIFNSLINIRPSADNRSLGVESKEIRERIIEIVNNLIELNE